MNCSKTSTCLVRVSVALGPFSRTYSPHNALGALRFRSCAVSGADWNPESGFDKWRVFCRKGNMFPLECTSIFDKMATQFCSEGAAGLSGSLRVSPSHLRCWLHGAEQHRLRFGGSRLRSIRHADCSLLHLTEEESLRSELKPGYSLGATQILDPISCPNRIPSHTRSCWIALAINNSKCCHWILLFFQEVWSIQHSWGVPN